MSRFSNIISDFYQIQKKFGYLQSINLLRDINNDGCSSFSLEIVLCGFPYYQGDQKLKLKFDGVRELKIGDLDGLLKIFINLRDISENQMEGIRLKVKEDENDLFSFYCQDFIYDIL